DDRAQQKEIKRAQDVTGGRGQTSGGNQLIWRKWRHSVDLTHLAGNGKRGFRHPGRLLFRQPPPHASPALSIEQCRTGASSLQCAPTSMATLGLGGGILITIRSLHGVRTSNETPSSSGITAPSVETESPVAM